MHDCEWPLHHLLCRLSLSWCRFRVRACRGRTCLAVESPLEEGWRWSLRVGGWECSPRAGSARAARVRKVIWNPLIWLATRTSKARPTIVRRFRKSWRTASPPPSLVTNIAVTRPSSSLVPFPWTALSQTSSRSDKRRSIRQLGAVGLENRVQL